MRLEMREEPQLLQQTETPTILVVDDEEIIRDICVRTLKNYRTLQAENGQEALRILDHKKVDLILVDVMMPVMNGLELLQNIKEQDPEQLVVVMTGYADKDIILRALKARADDFIHKPINLLQLRTSIANALEKKDLRRELVQLKQLDRIKSDFLGLISHKLRTPTTSISLFIQNLASGSLDLEDPGFASALDAICEESEYLAYLIQDLLYYSDIILQDCEGKASRDNLKEIAGSVLAEKRSAIEKKGLILHTTLAGNWPIVIVDRRRIAFALNALVDNAIKFTPTGGEITLSGEVGETEFSLTIADNGPGISPEEAAKVFEKFYQIDPQNTGQIRGFGLGLFYARQFIRDHGGTINLNSTPGKGTEITIRLPRLSITSSESSQP
ncbi:MAG: hybrid sensor histidine kinase/response regulator [Deltaproteobacteria bacterium]|nr:MAG: hybrid sensor histidine kinase/response regulator [Deltaproteobacteria bacterium]